MNRLIAAIDRKHGVAKQGILPWFIPEDEAYFTNKTKEFGGNVLTGSTTFAHTYKHGSLSGRQNFILTHNTEPIDGVTLVNDLAKFLEEFKDKELWVAGGANVFTQVMELGQADELYLTMIDADFGCNQFFPDFNKEYVLKEQSEAKEQNGFHFTFAIYTKKT